VKGKEDSFLIELAQLTESGVFDQQENDFFKDCYDKKDKKLAMIMDAFRKSQDHDDFIHSLSRYYKKNGPPKVVVEETNPFILEVETIAKYGKFEASVVEFCKRMYAEKDAKLMSVFNAYQRNYDRDDFIDSVKRYYARFS